MLKVLILAGFPSYFSPFEGRLAIDVVFLFSFMLRYLGLLYALSLGQSMNGYEVKSRMYLV